MLGVALAYKDSSANCQWIPALLCLLFAWVMQIDSNLVNDFFDFKHGNDDETRLGPKRACAEGWITMKAMKWGIIITTLLGCIIGLPLAFYGGKEMIIVGICCVLFCFLYTTKLSYLGLGDLLVLLFFGIVPVCCTYYLVMPEGMQTVSARSHTDFHRLRTGSRYAAHSEQLSRPRQRHQGGQEDADCSHRQEKRRASLLRTGQHRHPHHDRNQHLRCTCLRCRYRSFCLLPPHISCCTTEHSPR